MTQPPEFPDTPPTPPGGEVPPAQYPSYPTSPGGAPQDPANAYPPPPGAYPPPAGIQYGAPQHTNQLAVWSMVTGILAGILGLIGACGVIFGPVAIGLAIPARNQITNSQGAQKGSGMATAGLVLGIIGTAVSLMWIVLIATGVLDLPNFG